MRWMMSLLLLAACDKEDTADDAVSPCADEDRAETLSAGASFSGDSVSLSVLSADPETAYSGDNAWSVELSDGAGVLSGCSLSATIAMPDHGHGGPEPTFSEVGDGVYDLGVEFTMGGYWEMDVVVTCGDTEDVVPVVACVES